MTLGWFRDLLPIPVAPPRVSRGRRPPGMVCCVLCHRVFPSYGDPSRISRHRRAACTKLR